MLAARTLVVCALLVAAGCAAPWLGGTSSPTDRPTASPTPTPTATPLPDSARNPWRSTEVVVGVDGSVNPNRSFVPLVEAAVSYWNGPGRPDATYPATFRVDADDPDPDVVVRFRDRVDCAEHGDVLGCAPVLSADARPRGVVTIVVAAGFDDETTLRTLEHEFGHLLGIHHGEPPLPLMGPRYAAVTLPATDAVDKANPWTTDDLRIYVEFGDVARDLETRRFQVERAVEYYDAGAEGHVPENVSFTLVEDRTRAHVVVRFDRDREDCSSAAARSCGFTFGYDPDRDGALEYYTNATVVLNGIDPASTGWHLGYWLGVFMGHDRVEELAPPFRNATYEERRDEWWA